jgi:hypothetical protein
MGEAVFSLLSQRHELVSLSTMHEVVGEAILLNTFSKTAQFHIKSCSLSYFLKKQLY